jgi:hypothetical protein
MQILTPKGQVTREQEERAVEIWLKNFPKYSYVQTPKDEYATVDAVLSVDNVMQAIVETKCRELELDDFNSRFYGRLMIPFDKLAKAADIAKYMCVPFVCFLYLVQDDVLLYQKLWEPKAGWVCDMYVRPILMQATVNGGKALRSNAFVDMKSAKVLRG